MSSIINFLLTQKPTNNKEGFVGHFDGFLSNEEPNNLEDYFKETLI